MGTQQRVTLFSPPSHRRLLPRQRRGLFCLLSPPFSCPPSRLSPAVELAPKKAPASAPAPAAAPPAEDAPPPDPGPETDLRRLRVRSTVAAAFDPERTGSLHVDVVPSLMRSLNVFVPDAAWADALLPALQAAAGGAPGPLLPARAVEDLIVRLMEERTYEPDRPEALYAAFRALDTRNEGFVELPALRAALGCATGGGLPEQELDVFLRALAPKAFVLRGDKSDKNDKSGDKSEEDSARNRVYYADYICGMHVRQSSKPPAL